MNVAIIIANGNTSFGIPQEEKIMGITAQALPGIGGAAIATIIEIRQILITSPNPIGVAEILARDQVARPRKIAPQGI